MRERTGSKEAVGTWFPNMAPTHTPHSSHPSPCRRQRGKPALPPPRQHTRTLPPLTSGATNCIYLLIMNALLSPQRAVSQPLPSREQATGASGTAAGARGGQGGGWGQPPQPRGGRQRRPSQAGAARPPRRLRLAGKPHPTAPPDRGGVLGTPKGSHLAPHPVSGFPPAPSPLAPSGRAGPPSRAVPPWWAPSAALPRQELPEAGQNGRREEVKDRERSGTGAPQRQPGEGSLRGGPPSWTKPAGPGHRPAPAVAAPAPARR